MLRGYLVHLWGIIHIWTIYQRLNGKKVRESCHFVEGSVFPRDRNLSLSVGEEHYVDKGLLVEHFETAPFSRVESHLGVEITKLIGGKSNRFNLFGWDVEISEVFGNLAS